MKLPQMSGNAWVCTIVGLVLLASGAEQVYHSVRGDTYKAMQERMERERKQLDATNGPQPGQPAPDFTLTDPKGGKVSLAQFRGKPLVINFFCGCSRCETMAHLESKWQKQEKIPMIGLAFFDKKYFPDFRKKTGATFPIFKDEDKTIARSYNSLICPRVWVIDGKGRVVYTNPNEPDMMPYEDTVHMLKQAYAHPIPPALPPNPTQPRTQSAQSS